MNTSALRTFFLSSLFLSVTLTPNDTFAKRRPPSGGRIAVVVDERLSALRATPEFSGKLLRRMGRGSYVALKGEKRSREGVNFYRVKVNSRTSGWIQREAVVSPARAGDDARLLSLIKASDEFDRVVRARSLRRSEPRQNCRARVPAHRPRCVRADARPFGLRLKSASVQRTKAS